MKLSNWQITGFPLENYEHIEEMLLNAETIELNERGLLLEGPAVMHACFDIPTDQDILDTYLDPTGWGKVCSYDYRFAYVFIFKSCFSF